MELIKLSEEAYDEFAKKHPYANFLNSIYSGRKFELKNWTCEYLGLQDNTEIVAATLLVSTLLHKNRYFYAPRGFLIDYQNKEVLTTFTTLIKEYIAKQDALYLKIDPYVAYQQRDLNGKVVEDGFNHDDMIQNLKNLGFEHQGFNEGYDDSTQCRWMSVLDVRGKSKEELLKNMDSHTRQNINNTIKIGIKVKALEYDELNILDEIVSATSERRGFSNLSLPYYQDEYKVFKEHAKAYYAYLDLVDYQERLDIEQAQLEEALAVAQANIKENPSGKKQKAKAQTLKQQLASLEKRQSDLSQLKEEHDKEIPLAAAMFIKYGSEIIYLMSGSDEQYKRFKGPYAIQWEMICKTLEEGYGFYNFYGISGLFKEEDDGYGVFDFKRGFRADVVELLGDFILPINKGKYRMYKTMSGLKNKIKK